MSRRGRGVGNNVISSGAAAVSTEGDAALQQRLDDLVRETQDLRRAIAAKQNGGPIRNGFANSKRGRDMRLHGGASANRRAQSDTKRPKRGTLLCVTRYQHVLHADITDGSPAVGRVKWVSSEDDAKGVGRLIVGAAMASAVVGFPVSLHAKYEANVNTALKGVAIATKRCAEEQHTYVACAPSFRENRNELTLTVVKLAGPSPAVVDGRGDVLTVARATDYRVLAGAVAKRARDDSPSVLRAIGAAAVFAAARALATCREYLEQDGDDTDVVAVPRFSKVHVDGRDGETTVLELCVFPSTPATPNVSGQQDAMPAD